MPLEQPELNPGETYVGVCGAPGAVFHIIKLPGDNPPAPAAAQASWAESLGGNLPSKAELALLWRIWDQFQPDWYVSEQMYENEPGMVWRQNFQFGYQDYTASTTELRAVAIRRVPV